MGFSGQVREMWSGSPNTQHFLSDDGLELRLLRLEYGTLRVRPLGSRGRALLFSLAMIFATSASPFEATNLIRIC